MCRHVYSIDGNYIPIAVRTNQSMSRIYIFDIRRRTARMQACNRRIRRRTACNVVYCAFIYILYIISISVDPGTPTTGYMPANILTKYYLYIFPGTPTTGYIINK